MMQLAFHTLVTSLNFYGIWYDQKYIDVPFPRAKAFLHFPLKGRSAFFTTWTFIIQTLYFIVAAANDIFGNDDPSSAQVPLIRTIRDTIFASLAVPFAINVTIIFWVFYTLNRELIFPKKADNIVPSWLNHLMHSAVLVFILIEMCISPHNYPSKTIGLSLVSSVASAYGLWTTYIYYRTGKWVYPFFDVFNWPQRITWGISTVFFSIILYYLGEYLNMTVWSSETLQTKVF